jgi:hypothetical protein
MFARKGLPMNDKAFQNRDQLAAAYLQQLQTLAFEIVVAMDAIAINALTSFQESVAKQEMLCAVLATMTSTIGAEISASGRPLPTYSDSTLELKIQATVGVICTLNLQYAALLKHSGKSIALLASLCRSHTGESMGARGSGLKRQTWSCEM